MKRLPLYLLFAFVFFLYGCDDGGSSIVEQEEVAEEQILSEEDYEVPTEVDESTLVMKMEAEESTAPTVDMGEEFFPPEVNEEELKARELEVEMAAKTGRYLSLIHI